MAEALELLTKELDRFIESKAPQVFCIRGEWGVGKTYAWEQYLIAANNADQLPLANYAYVSLFGIQTLDQLKAAIFENTISNDLIGTTITLDSFKEKTVSSSAAAARKRGTQIARAVGFGNLAAALETWSFLAINEQLICFDDIERKGAGLRLADVLGLISYLAERRKCKVIVILNEQELSDEDKSTLKTYHEKVIDVSLKFSPTEEECAKIALSDGDEIQTQLGLQSIKLGVSNIRIIKKIERLVRQVHPMLKDYDQTVTKQAIETLMLFGWAFFSKKDDLLEFSLKKRGRGFYGTSRSKLSQDEEKWDDLLDKYGFSAADDFDKALLQGIEVGYFNEDSIKFHAETQDELQKQIANNANLETAWRRFHDSFDSDGTAVVEGILKAFYENIQRISPLNLDSTVWLLKGLGKTKEASDVIASYFSLRNEKRTFYDLHNHTFGVDIKDSDVRKAFKDAYDKFSDTRVPIDILKELVASRNWNEDDIMLIATLTADDLRTYLKSLDGYELRRAIKTLLDFSMMGGQGSAYQTIYERSLAALQEIGRESPINRMRMTKYGIVIP